MREGSGRRFRGRVLGEGEWRNLLGRDPLPLQDIKSEPFWGRLSEGMGQEANDGALLGTLECVFRLRFSNVFSARLILQAETAGMALN